MKALLLLCLAALACAAQETWELFYAAEGAEPSVLVERVKPLLPKDIRLREMPLPADCRDAQAAKQHEAAIAAGVHTLPCLVLRDARGAYAALPLQGLSPETLQTARAQASAPGRESAHRRRSRTARVYYLKALWLLVESAQEQDKIIAAYRAEMQREGTDEELKQFIGFYCLYPALMQQYAAEYSGAHTPRTEAKLLEAISALEEARDLNPDSHTGRLAYDERERLRAARLKSRQYE